MPCQDLFFEMIKMSMATFINAMTGSDCTYYPVATTLNKIYSTWLKSILMQFHPLLTDQTFEEKDTIAPLDPEKPTAI